MLNRMELSTRKPNRNQKEVLQLRSTVTELNSLQGFKGDVSEKKEPMSLNAGQWQ
jgi:hypothetical protein